MNKDYAHSMQDDIISRQDAMGTMLNLFHWCTMPTRKEIRKAIEAIPSAEPRTYGVLCALADRECPFQGKEYAWCLTCPHISEEDRELVRKAINPRTGEWVDWLGKGTEWECSVCKCSIESHGSIAYRYCPMCGADMRGEKHEEQ